MTWFTPRTGAITSKRRREEEAGCLLAATPVVVWHEVGSPVVGRRLCGHLVHGGHDQRSRCGHLWNAESATRALVHGDKFAFACPRGGANHTRHKMEQSNEIKVRVVIRHAPGGSEHCGGGSGRSLAQRSRRYHRRLIREPLGIEEGRLAYPPLRSGPRAARKKATEIWIVPLPSGARELLHEPMVPG